MRLLPWILAAGFAISTLVLALRSSESAPNAPAAPAPAPAAAQPAPMPTPAPPAEQLAALRRCTARLDAARAAAAAATGTTDQPCPQTAEELAEQLAVLRADERDERRLAMRGMVQDYLGITTEQSGFLMDYVCAVRGMRADVIEDIRAQKLDLKGAAQRQDAERKETLEDIERLLGPEKYKQLREVGGIGKLGDLFDCV